MKTLSHLTRTATHVATLPISAVAFATGLVKGAVGRIAHAVAGGDVPEQRRRPARPEASPEAAHATTPEAQVVPLEEFPEAAPQRSPEAPSEAFAHEPHPVTLRSVPSRRSEADVDDWDGDAELAVHPDEEPAAESVVEALARNDRPGDDQVDRAAISAALREAELLRGDPES